MIKKRDTGVQLPERQPIAGNPYMVSEVPRMYGQAAICDRGNKLIVIEADAPSEWERTIRFAHECIHAGEQEYGMGPFKDDPEDSDVDRLAHLFTEMHYNIVLSQK